MSSPKPPKEMAALSSTLSPKTRAGRLSGTTAWSKTYRGKPAILNDLIAPLRRVLAPPLKTHAHRFIAEGDIVVVEARGQNVTRDGRPYENNYCYVFEFRDGEVAALTEYADTELFRSALGEPG